MASQRGVSLAGAAAPGPHGLLTAPLSAVECVWYRVRAESWQVHGDAHHWRPVLGAQRGNPFAVDDVLVDASIVEIEPAILEEVRVRRPPGLAQAPMLHRLAELGMLPRDELERGANAFDELAWRVTEEVIEVGRLVTVSGTLVTRFGRKRLRQARWWRAAV